MYWQGDPGKSAKMIFFLDPRKLWAYCQCCYLTIRINVEYMRVENSGISYYRSSGKNKLKN